jgi:hypothetical protein
VSTRSDVLWFWVTFFLNNFKPSSFYWWFQPYIPVSTNLSFWMDYIWVWEIFIWGICFIQMLDLYNFSTGSCLHSMFLNRKNFEKKCKYFVICIKHQCLLEVMYFDFGWLFFWIISNLVLSIDDFNLTYLFLHELYLSLNLQRQRPATDHHG